MNKGGVRHSSRGKLAKVCVAKRDSHQKGNKNLGMSVWFQRAMSEKRGDDITPRSCSLFQA